MGEPVSSDGLTPSGAFSQIFDPASTYGAVGEATYEVADGAGDHNPGDLDDLESQLANNDNK